GRKRGLIVIGGAVGESLQTGPVRFHAIQIRGAVALRSEDDRCPIGRPCGVVIDVGRSDQWAFVAPVSVCQEQTNLTWLREHPGEHDLLRLGCLGQCESSESDEKMCAHREQLLVATGDGYVTRSTAGDELFNALVQALIERA